MTLTRDTLFRRTRRLKSIKDKKKRMLVEKQKKQKKLNSKDSKDSKETKKCFKNKTQTPHNLYSISQAWDEWHDKEDGHRDAWTQRWR